MAACDDGNACTTGTTCGPTGICQGGSAVSCDDSEPCTTDICSSASGCVFVKNSNSCDDGNECTTGDVCGNGSCAPTGAVDCDDGNVCTEDSCAITTGICLNSGLPFNTNPCDDGDACTDSEFCTGGICGDGTTVTCDDSEPCTNDICNSSSGCFNVNNNNSCSDGEPCTLNDVCSAGSCAAGTADTCDDGNLCTTDSCTGSGCSNVNNTVSCNDGDVCTVGEACSAGACAGGTAFSCDDNNPCTTDSCTANVGCTYIQNASSCDDNTACTSGDVCSSGVCAGTPVDCDDSEACTTDVCDSIGGCVSINNSDSCDDGTLCTTDDRCASGSCSGTTLSCDDSNLCTTDSCSAGGGCANANNTVSCNDGDVCTVGEACSAGACAGGTAFSCDDNNPCTTDSCTANVGCTYIQNASSCDDNTACTSGDVCSSGVCAGTPVDCDDSEACTTDVCDSIGGCVSINNSDSCNDGTLCTTDDRCASGSCGGTTLSCDDSNLCTSDSCSAGGGCANANNTVACEDGDACTAPDACAGGSCAGGSAVDCDDNNLCTTDICNEAAGCISINNEGSCDDLDACTRGDSCSAGGCAGVDTCEGGGACAVGVCTCAGDRFGEHCAVSLVVAGSPDTDVQAGSTWTVSATVTNESSSFTSSDVRVRATIPGGATFAPPASCQVNGSLITCSLGALFAGNSATVDLVFDISEGTANGSVLTSNISVLTEAETSPDHQLPVSVNVVAAPDLSVTASAGGGEVSVGSLLIYTVNWSNLGANAGTGTALAVTVPTNTTFNSGVEAGWSCSNGASPPTECTFDLGAPLAGASGTVKFAVTVNQSLANTVESIEASFTIDDDDLAVGHIAETVTSNNASGVSTAVSKEPDLVIEKSAVIAGGKTSIDPGDIVVYTLAFRNEGNQTAFAPVITETIPENTVYTPDGPSVWSCPDGFTGGNSCTYVASNLPPFATGSVDFRITVDDALPSSIVTIPNTASIDADGNDLNFDDNVDSFTLSVEEAADVAITGVTHDVTTAGGVFVGVTIHYTINYENLGVAVAPVSELSVAVPDFTTFAVAPASHAGWTCGSGTCTFSLGDLNPNASGTVVFAATVDSALAAAVAEIATDFTIDFGGGGQTELSKTNNTLGVSIDVAAAADVTVTTLTDSGGPVTLGDTITYTIGFDNIGTASASGVVLTETVPVGTTLAPGNTLWDCNGTAAGTICTRNLGSLAPNQPATASFVVVVNDTLTAAETTIDNTSTISRANAGAPELSTVNDSALVQTAVVAGPDIQVEVSADATVATVDQTVVYTITYRNQGTAAAAGVEVSAQVPTKTTYQDTDQVVGGPPGLNPWTCGGTTGGSLCVITVGALPAGGPPVSVTFTVTADSDLSGIAKLINPVTIIDDDLNGTDLDAPNDSVTHEILVGGAPDLSLILESDATTAVSGDTITYTLRYRNNGSEIAEGVTIQQVLPANTDIIAADTTGDWEDHCTAGLADLGNGLEPVTQCELAIGTIGSQSAEFTAEFVVRVTPPLDATATEIITQANIKDATNEDLNEADNTRTLSVPLAEGPHLVLTMTGNPDQAQVTNPIVYSMIWKNIGNATADGVKLLAQVPVNTTFNAGLSGFDCGQPTCPTWLCANQGQAGASCQLSVGNPLLADANAEFTGTFAVTVAGTIPPELEEISFAASITDDGNNGIDLNLDADRTALVNTLARGPDLTVTSSPSVNPVAVGATTVFTFTAANTGTAVATSPQLSVTIPEHTTPENFATNWDCPAPGSPPPVICTTKAGVLTTMPEDGTNQQVTLDIAVAVTLPAGALQTVLTVSVEDLDAAGDLAPADNETTTTLDLSAGPDLQITSLAPDAATKQPGDLITYTFNLANQGTRGATGVVLTQTVPTATTYSVTNTDPWTCVDSTCTIDVGTLEVTDSQSFSFDVVVDEPLPAGVAQTTDVVDAADDAGNGSDLTTPNAVATDVTLSAAADLQVEYTSPNSVAPGQELVYTVNFFNSGDRNASGVVLVAKVPDLYATLVTPQDDSWVCADGQGNAGTLCTHTFAGSLVGGVAAAGDVGSESIEFRVLVDETLPAGVNSISSVVTISDNVDGGVVDDEKTRETSILAGPDLVLSEVPSIASSAPNGSIRYSLDVVNDGTQAATGLEFGGVVPPNTRFMISNSSDGWQCDLPTVDNLVASGAVCSLVIPAEDLPALEVGQSLPIEPIFQVLVDTPLLDGVVEIVSSFSVSDDRPPGDDQNPIDNLSTTSIPVVADPDLSVDKVADAALKEPGDLITYTLDYANDGNQNTQAVFLYEQVPANTSYAGGAGSGWTCAINDVGLLDDFCEVDAECCVFEIGVLAVGAPGSTDFVVSVDKPLASGVSQITNRARIADDGSNHDDALPRIGVSPTVVTQLDATAGLALEFVSPDESVQPGGVVTYRVDYRNEGVQNASNVDFTITLPFGVSLDVDRSETGPWICIPLANPPSTRCSVNLGEVAVGASGEGQVHFVVEVADDIDFGTAASDILINASVEDIGAVPPQAPELAQALTVYARCSVEHNAETSPGKFVAEPLDAENPGLGSLWEHMQSGALPGGYWRTAADGVLPVEGAKAARLNLALTVPELTAGGLSPVVEVVFDLQGQSAPNQDPIVLCLAAPAEIGDDFSCSTASGALQYQTGKNTSPGAAPGNAGPIDFNDGQFDHVFLDLQAWAGQDVVLSIGYQPNGTDDAYQGLAVLSVRQFSDADADGQLDGDDIACDFCWDLDADGFANQLSPVFNEPHPYAPPQSCDVDSGDGIDKSVADCDDTKGVLNSDCSEDCADGIDNNLNNALDCADTQCQNDPACFPCEKTFTFESGDMGWAVTPSGATAIKFINRRVIGDPTNSGWQLQEGSADTSFKAFLYRTISVPAETEMPIAELVVTYKKTAIGIFGACFVDPEGDLTAVENCPASAAFKTNENTPDGESITRVQPVPPEWIGKDVRVVLFYDGEETDPVDADVFVSHASIRSDVDGDDSPEGSTPSHAQCDSCVDLDGDNYGSLDYLAFSTCGPDCNDEDIDSNPDATSEYECATVGDQNCDAVEDDDDQACRVCGDGKVTAGEQCDDGPIAVPVNDDGCSADCQLEVDDNSGRFYITEIHVSQFNDATQQWFELRNGTGADVDPLALDLQFQNVANAQKLLADCVFPDGAGGFTSTPKDLLILRGDYFVVSLGTPENSLLDDADAYCSGNLVLAETGGDRLLVRAGSTVLDIVDYRGFECEITSSIVESAGIQRSLELQNPESGTNGLNDSAGRWCLAATPVQVGGVESTTNFGSPGTGGSCDELFCDNDDDDCDGLIDEVDGGLVDDDGDLVCDDPDVDCNSGEPLCALDCVTDADGDSAPDCEDGCIDADGDGYGAPGNNPRRDLVCSGCVNPKADCEFCSNPDNEGDPFCDPCKDPKSLVERCLTVCDALPELSCPGVECTELFLDCQQCQANPDDPSCPNCNEFPDDYRCAEDCAAVAGQNCATRECENPRAHCEYCAGPGNGKAECAICQVAPESTQKCVADCSLLTFSTCEEYGCTNPRAECEDCKNGIGTGCSVCTDNEPTNDIDECTKECGGLPTRVCPSTDCNDTQLNGGDVNIGALEGEPGAVQDSCTDGLDNDCDGLTDCSDDSCKGSIECQGATCDKPLFIECGVPQFVQPASADLPCGAGADSVVQFKADAKEFQDQGTGTVIVRILNAGPNAYGAFTFENACSAADICAPDDQVPGLCAQERQQEVNVEFDSIYNIVVDEVTSAC
ncbi:MAG: putative repeat protein (TIGR01451 family), partial [Myxococcota bacterium]